MIGVSIGTFAHADTSSAVMIPPERQQLRQQG
jgi:hypothetical protein